MSMISFGALLSIYSFSQSWPLRHVKVLHLICLNTLLTDPSLVLDTYYLAFPKDRPLLKFAVGWVYLIGVAQIVFTLMDLYNMAIAKLCNRWEQPPDHYWFSVITSSAVGKQCVTQKMSKYFLLISISCIDNSVALCQQDLCDFQKLLDFYIGHWCAC